MNECIYTKEKIMKVLPIRVYPYVFVSLNHHKQVHMIHSKVIAEDKKVFWISSSEEMYFLSSRKGSAFLENVSFLHVVIYHGIQFSFRVGQNFDGNKGIREFPSLLPQ